MSVGRMVETRQTDGWSGLGCGGEKGSKCVDWILVVALATGNWRGWQVNKPLSEQSSTTFGRFREPGGIESGH